MSERFEKVYGQREFLDNSTQSRYKVKRTDARSFSSVEDWENEDMINEIVKALNHREKIRAEHNF